uniref:Integrator complex subunit 5 C-terminal domain-containing protein n=1 Tax=Ditylenchus dipsaci TaxID=166011 RepID=A0A915CWP2_9BILA
MSEKDITRILEAVHCDRKVRSEHLPLVNKGIVDGQLPHFKQRDIKAILAGGPSGQLSAKVSYVIGLLNGVEKCSELIARLLFMASDQKELENFVSFALTLSPIFPNVVTLGVAYLVSNIRQLTIEFQREEEVKGFVKSPYSEPSARLSSGNVWLKNLLTLISWQKHAPEDSLLNCLGLNLADVRGDLQVGLFDWALSYLDHLDQGNGWDQPSSEVFICFLDLLKVGNLHLPIRACNRLVVLFSALVVLLLKLIKKENFGSSFDGVDMVCHCYAIAGLFFTAQQSVDRSVLIKSLLNDIFENSAAIIGTRENLSSVGSEISFDKFPPSFLSGKI